MPNVSPSFPRLKPGVEPLFGEDTGGIPLTASVLVGVVQVTSTHVTGTILTGRAVLEEEQW